MGNVIENVLSSLLSPNRPISCPYHHRKRRYQAKTPFGFIAPYRLNGLIEVRDRVAFQGAVRAHGGSIDEVLDRFVDAFHAEIFLPILEEHRQFFLYHLGGYGELMLELWRYEETSDGALVVNPCDYYSKDGLYLSIQRALQDFIRYGCVMQTVGFYCHEEILPFIEENLRMIHPQALARIRQEGQYLQRVEKICIAALFERAKLLPDAKTHGRSGFATLQTQLVGDALKISWKNAKAGEGWKLMGFRRTGGFAPDEFSESGNGVLVVDSAASEGSTVEATLARNEPVYYTFFLRKIEGRLLSNERYYLHERVARFAETIPDADTVRALEKRLEETRLKAQIAEAERKATEANQGPLTFDEQRRAGMESQLRLAKDALGLLRAVDEIEGDALKELDNAPERFTPERAEAWRDEVMDLCAKLRENVRRLV